VSKILFKKEEGMKPKCKAVVGVVVLCLLLGFGHSALFADEYGDAKKAYESGQNETALRLLVIKLRKDNDHKDAIALFKIVLNLVIDKRKKAAQDYEARKDWDKAFE